MEFLNVNPVFLFIFFSFGFVIGLLTKNITGWKFVALGFTAIFVYQPLRDAGVAAVVSFCFGILIHHLPVFSDALLSMREWATLPRRRARYRPRNPHQGTTGGGYQNAEQARADFNDFSKQQKAKQEQERKTSEKKSTNQRQQSKTHSSNQQRSTNQNTRNTAEEERLRRENERLRKEAAEARKAAQSANKDTRTAEEILGLKPGYSKADLKKAYMQKVREWHPDHLKEKAPELMKIAEEELKKINDAYDKLK